MTVAEVLLALAIDVPIALLAACASSEMRQRMPSLLPYAPLPALAAAIFAPAGTTLILPDALLGLTFVLDLPGALLLGTASLLWSAAAVYARRWLEERADRGTFSVWWLMTLTGCLGVFIAADLIGFYLFFTVVSLSAYGLVVSDGTAEARRAGSINVSFAILSEAFLLMGFVLLAAHAPDGSLLIADGVAALPASPSRDVALLLLVLGFGVKVGLVPFHVWMPPTYTASPIPVAAVLSGTGVKAGVIGFIRFLPFDTPLPGWGEFLAAVGFLGAFYGVAVGLTRSDPKAVLAYSSVSQMGLITAVMGLGLAAGEAGVAVAAAFYALHHMLVKGGLFLAVGAAGKDRAREPWPVLAPAAVIALGLGGLPLTGGYLAKLAIKDPLGYGLAATLGMLSAVATTLLMLHFLQRLRGEASREAGSWSNVAWLAVAFAAVAVPWALYGTVMGTSATSALSTADLWKNLWPVLVGVALAIALRRFRSDFPSGPAVDLPMMPAMKRMTQAVGDEMARLDYRMRQWPVAGLLFLTLTLAMAATMLAGR